MAFTLTTGSSQDAAGTSLVPNAPPPDDYVVSVDDPGQTVLVNIGGAVSQPNKIRYSISTIADTFKGTDAEPIAGQRINGLSILCQVTETWKVEDSNTGFIHYLPISAHMVLKFPVDEVVTGETLSSLIQRLIGALDRGEKNVEDNLNRLINGVTKLPDYDAGT